MPIGARPAADPLVGWRYWQLAADGSGLRSVSHRRFGWAAGQPLRASCVGGGHRSPAEGCNCGIWAARDLEGLRSRGMCLAPEGVVAGEVALWGRVASDEASLRGEYAYPRSLFLVEDTVVEVDRPSAMAALAAYGVPAGAMALHEAVGDVSGAVLAFQAMSQRARG